MKRLLSNLWLWIEARLYAIGIIDEPDVSPPPKGRGRK